MSILVTISEYFYSLCSHLAEGVEAAKGIIRYVADTNYNLVAAVISFIGAISETFSRVVEAGASYLQFLLLSVTNVLHSVSESVDSAISFVCRMMHAMYSSTMDVYDSVVDLNSSVVNFVSHIVLTVRNTTLDMYASITSVFSWSVTSFVSLVVAMYTCLTSIGQFCVNVVTGLWHCLGYTFSSIAYFPMYCFDCVDSLKNQITHNIVHAITAMPKETYLVMICLCLSYFTLSNTVRYVNSHGLRKLFSSRFHSSRVRSRTTGTEWQFVDRDFESDFEDLYGNDANSGNVWMIPGMTRDTADTDSGRVVDVSDSESDRSDGSDSDTVDDDDDLSDDDDDDDEDGSQDGYTVISDDSDSDNSLNSQTLSTESSEQEIEVNLPTVDERYSLRSRSSTPSLSCQRSLSSPEEFEREMEREKDKRKCVVCQDQVKSVLIMPCRHMCMCVLCADQIVRSRSASRRVCPLCRTKIQKVMNVYV